MTRKEWTVLFVGCVVLAVLLLAVSAMSQTYPVSTVTSAGCLQSAEDTTCTGEILIQYEVEWDEEWSEAVGIYYRIPGVLDEWNYAGASYEWFLVWVPPVWEHTYHFASQTNDDTYHEPYPHDRPEPQQELEAFLTMEQPPDPECPQTSPLQALVILAEWGFDMEPDTPVIRWYWSHPTTGSQVTNYRAEWKVDGVIAVIDSIAVGDTTFAFWDAPHTPGQTQTIRVQGEDAAHRLGPMSVWGNPYEDDGPPGQVEEPHRTLIME
jgi:hypothetical protein